MDDHVPRPGLEKGGGSIAGRYWGPTINLVPHCNNVDGACDEYAANQCWAKTNYERWHRAAKPVPYYQPAFEDITFLHDNLSKFAALDKKPGQVVYVNLTGDLFHPGVSFEDISLVFDEMFQHPRHTYLLLTKRPQRMCDFVYDYVSNVDDGSMRDFVKASGHIWLGTTVENQERANERIPWLMRTPGMHHWLSMEPLRGPVDLGSAEHNPVDDGKALYYPLTGSIKHEGDGYEQAAKIEWIVTGGATGPHAAPSMPGWFRMIRNQCITAKTTFTFKSWGKWIHCYDTAETGEPVFGFKSHWGDREQLLDGVAYPRTPFGTMW